MSSVRQVHERAMELLDLALDADRKGSPSASEYREQAYQLEKQAADLLAAITSPEPSRSVLHRSAATLALRCGHHEVAEQLIYRALGGDPPSDVSLELKDLLEEVSFSRHLNVRGVTLSNDEFQLTLVGDEVGFGFAPARALTDRLQATSSMIIRTFERHSEQPYREAGRIKRQVSDMAQAYVSVPRAASFAVSIKVGSTQQASLDLVGSTEQVVDEIFQNLQLFESQDLDGLRKQIHDEAYFRNFLGLARILAPDGRAVRTVGLTTIRQGRVRKLALRRAGVIEQSSPESLKFENGSTQAISTGTDVILVEGVLRFADSLKNKNQIRLEGKGAPTTLVVPVGLMDDIVRPLWNTWVRASATRRGKQYVIDHISAAEISEI